MPSLDSHIDDVACFVLARLASSVECPVMQHFVRRRFALAIHFHADTFVHWTGSRGDLAMLAKTSLHAYAPLILFAL